MMHTSLQREPVLIENGDYHQIVRVFEADAPIDGTTMRMHVVYHIGRSNVMLSWGGTDVAGKRHDFRDLPRMYRHKRQADGGSPIPVEQYRGAVHALHRYREMIEHTANPTLTDAFRYFANSCLNELDRELCELSKFYREAR